LIIDRNLTSYIVTPNETIAGAVSKIADNRQSIICSVDEHGIMEGLFTNGDFLRWLSQQDRVDLQQPVSAILNRDFLWASPSDGADRINELLEKVQFVPMLNERGRLVGVARRRDERIRIGSRVVDEDAPAFVIAEIGNNHNGSLELAKRLVDAAVEAEADCAKFQMRNLKTLYHNAGDAEDASENLGSQYTLDLLSRFQLSVEEMFEAFDYCKDRGIIPLCTPWDLDSVAVLEDYGMLAYKVASADMTNFELLQALAATGKPLICSTGMADEEEIEQTITLLQELGAQYVLLNCNSTYPAPFKDVHLRYMDRLAELGQSLVGHSGHERGIHVAVAAAARGAKVIEKHITLDRGMEGNDHKVSLLPHEFKQMVTGIREVEAALGSAGPRQITQGERMNRSTLAKSLVINQTVGKGDIITEAMIEVKSPGKGLQPNRLSELIGRHAVRDMEAGDFFYPSDLHDERPQPRDYEFGRPWGIPVRYHDYRQLMHCSNFDLLEFHLSYKDMDLAIGDFFSDEVALDLVVHSPEIFTNDHLLNLASEDEAYRKRSIHELQRVVDITRRLQPYFKRAEKPLIVVNMGGFTRDRRLTREERPALYARVADSLEQVDDEGVEIIAQTMPPFPWLFGGQMLHNLFLDAEDTAAFCAEYGYRLCFDVSHTMLACNHFNWSFSEFIERVGPYITHLHIVDARGEADEGLQIGEGDVDFPALAKQLERLAPDAPFIPEIWQGHENGGEGFWLALERLEAHF
jgi:N-acetylneuraminate synthase